MDENIAIEFAERLANQWLKSNHHPEEQLLLIGPRVTERSADMFRSLGVNYLDQSGNAYITFDGVHIDVRGRRPANRTASSKARASRGAVLFSPKRSQISFCHLAWPFLLQRPLRTIAATAGVSIGQAQQTLELLTEHGFLNQDRAFGPHERERLLDHWALAYPLSIGSPHRTLRFSGTWQNLDTKDVTCYFSGEAAVGDFIRSETLTLYIDGTPNQLVRSHRWRRNDENPTIFIRKKFWSEPVEHDERDDRLAPWPLIYADLLASRDERQLETAKHVRQPRSQPVLATYRENLTSIRHL